MTAVVQAYYDPTLEAFDMRAFMNVNFRGQFGRMVAVIQQYRGQLEYLQVLQPGTSSHVLSLYESRSNINTGSATSFRIMPLRAYREAMAFFASTSDLVTYMAGAPVRGPLTQLVKTLPPYITKFNTLKAAHSATLAHLETYPQNDPPPQPAPLVAIPRLGGIWSVDSDAIIAYLAKIGTYSALLVSSALRQHTYPMDPHEPENTEVLVRAAVAEAAALSLVIDEGVFKIAADYAEAVVPIALFQTFKTPHLVDTSFSPYLGACDIVNAITTARGGAPAEILVLAGDPTSGGLCTQGTITFRVGPKAPILSVFLYGAFLAKTGISAASYLALQPAQLIAAAQSVPGIIGRALDGGSPDVDGGADRGLMISDPQNTIGYLLAPINDALTVALTGIETFVSSGMNFLSDFSVPTINIRIPLAPTAPSVPDVEPYVKELTTALARGVTDAGDVILRQCNTILSDYRKFLNSGLIQDVAIELNRAVTAGLEIYFGILNEAVAIWSKTIGGILKGLVVKIEPKIKHAAIAASGPPSLPAIAVRAHPPVVTEVATRSAPRIPAVVSDITEGVHIIGFVMLMVIFLSVLFRVI
jgi:hypothetical protein